MSKLTQFDYLLNAMEAGAQQENPASYGYAQKRQALYAYVRGLENRPSPLDDLSAPASPAPDWLVKAAADTRARYADGVIRGPEYIVGPPAFPAPMPTIQVGDIVESTHADVARVETKMEAELWNDNRDLVVEVYRDPLWRRPAPMPTKGDE